MPLYYIKTRVFESDWRTDDLALFWKNGRVPGHLLIAKYSDHPDLDMERILARLSDGAKFCGHSAMPLYEVRPLDIGVDKWK